MEQPEGFAMGGSEATVCRLDRSLCGLKQAPRQLVRGSDSFFCGDHEMTRNTADLYLYVCRTPSLLMSTALYVDDLLMDANWETVWG